MKFGLIDRIVEHVRGEHIVALKAVTLAEEYLADHFPTYPVLPGVLMLEAMTQAAAWLVRDALDFEPGVILLREAKNVTYKSFVRPGNLLRVEVTCRRLARGESDFDGLGSCDEQEVVKARFGLRHWAAGRAEGFLESVDRRILPDARAQFESLCRASRLRHGTGASVR